MYKLLSYDNVLIKMQTKVVSASSQVFNNRSLLSSNNDLYLSH